MPLGGVGQESDAARLSQDSNMSQVCHRGVEDKRFTICLREYLSSTSTLFIIAGRNTAISGGFLSAVISIRYILGFRKDNPNVFNMLVQNWSHC